jgi:LuxR family transcriptional regulator, maltose regulon positive regulatory protein
MPLPAVLTTKLFFPPVRHDLVSRPRLLEKVTRGLQSRLILISAPAGYGKTTLLAEWRSGPGSRMPVAWFSLDNEDNNISRFLIYLASALGNIKAGIGEATLAILQSPQPPTTQVILTALINDLTATLTVPSALVLDDYHCITAQPVHEALTYLIDHLPPQMCLVLLTRADPPLPLTRLRARGQLTEIRAVDLRFSVNEAAAFLNQVMGLDLPDEQVAALEARTEGWIAGLQLAALSIQSRDEIKSFISAFTGSHRYIIDYLTDEVLNMQAAATRKFLLQTSIIDKMTASLCDALTGRTGSQTLLEELDRSNLFLVPLDDERCWYRYHPLFMDVLRDRLRQAYPDQVPALHRRATEWYECNRFISEALGHALAAGELDYAARLVEQNALPMILSGELTTLLGWIAKVEIQATERPWLSIFYAWALVHTGQQDKAEVLVDKVDKRILLMAAPGDLKEMNGHILAIRAQIAVYRWDGLSAIKLGQQALGELSESNLPVRSFAVLVVGSAFFLIGDLESASRFLAEAHRIGKAAGNYHVAVLSTFMLANIQADQGKLHQAEETYREALQMATTPAGQYLPVAARAFNGLARVFYEWNDLDAVEHYIKQCVNLAQKWGNINALVSAHVIQARVKQARGDFKGAKECFYDVDRLKHDHSLAPGGAGVVEIFRVGLWLVTGNLDAAVDWYQKRGFKTDDDVPALQEAEYITFARVLLAENKVDAALDLVRRLLPAAEGNGKTETVIELLILRALGLQIKNDHSQALKTLDHALALAQPGNYVRMFLDEGTPMINLLRRAGTAGVYPAYVKKLLSATLPVDERKIPAQPLIEPLSERELEILRLVAAGKSNKEIASALYIATGTVKKHLNNIFGKLGVKSRTQCLVQARKLNLL